MILNHSWKNRLRVGVRTSASISCVNPAARSLRKGRRSFGASAAGAMCLSWVIEPVVKGSALGEELVGVKDRSKGRNSAGPSGLL